MPSNERQALWLEACALKMGFLGIQELCMEAAPLFDLLGAAWRLAHAD